MPIRRWIDSANNAIEGILKAARTERHVRYHLYAAVMVLISALILGVSRAEFLLLALAAVVVVTAELLNTALEHAVDLFDPGQDDRARSAKDVAAGAVLVAAVGALVVGYVVLAPHITAFVSGGFRPPHRSPADVALVAVILVLIFVILAKAFFGTGTPLRGGLPSGHAAVAFSVWISLAAISRDPAVGAIGFVVACLVGISRIALGIHSFTEVFWGGLIGALTTFLLFLLFV
jgi:diacylglycerol kinase (ATP)